ncbi:succinate--hydroxymethylglutarate CoA-transferase [Malassezia caprae]|uniref:Kinesin-like protein n=1 Tax=Malassezia caprae TaxID=1381934 RepID=A0AAF0E875_9BASI|nr:succinate--hydroxymethylglutarate CoA-transferase [Malassezia caprae]
MGLAPEERRTGFPTKPDMALKRSVAGSVGARVPMSGIRTPSASSVGRLAELGVSSEPIQAFLRIRPDNHDSQMDPYLKAVSETEAVLNPPSDASVRRYARLRHAAQAPTKYTFSRVFAPMPCESPKEAQESFFQRTTLSPVKDLLEGKNSLVFTYGVTNSGKTYTVQGNDKPGEAGILPRTMDVIFNSIQGRECNKAVRPMGLTGVQPGVSDPSKSLLASRPRAKLRPGMGRAADMGSGQAGVPEPLTTDPTTLDVHPDYRYSVWVSYVEVYNEKLYDLLEAPMPSLLARSDAARDEAEEKPSGPARRPLLLKSEVESGGKYVGGLKEIKVNSIHEAREILRCGQENRTVFSTMANRSSSRSHSVFTIKILRELTSVQLGERDVSGLSRKYFVSRLSIVDLAGSERIANTDVSAGPRLKEAGSINKSLMCLGQCLETMRKNQLRAGIVSPCDARMALSSSRSDDTRKRRQSIVPFRHSKLTELFQSFFMGDGKVVMIVNVNPYGTGYEESANVMRFSAMAKEVGIQVSAAPGPAPGSADVSSLSLVSQAESDHDEEVDEDTDEFVNMLLEENERLRQRCERAESLCQTLEKTVRDEMAQHMEEALSHMRQYYERQLQAEIDASDAFLDRKIDLLARMTRAAPQESSFTSSETDDESVSAAPVLQSNASRVNQTPRASAPTKPTDLAGSADESQDGLILPHTPSPQKRMRRLGARAVQNDDMERLVHHMDTEPTPSHSLRRALR